MGLAKNEQDERSIALAVGWLLVFFAAVLAYWPGLDGPFLLDDFGSVAALGNYGGITDWPTFKAFVFGGHAGPTGRPLSLITFLIDANNWPAESGPFKRTNLIIHLINGALLGVVITQVLKVLEFKTREARWIALAATACWLLHPFLVSTTLYVVQRMAQLATMFMFLGLVGYLRGRVMVPTNPKAAYITMSVALGVCTLLAVFSKENGILLPLLAGVLEFTVMANRKAKYGSLNRAWAFVFILAPTAVIGLYLARVLFAGTVFEVVPPRDYSLFERALTQPRVLVDYLLNWFVPKLYTTGIFQDHFVKSTGLLSPVTTILAFLVNGGLITIALVKRQQWPIFSLAILFFFAGHVLESTVLNLELYFEHRNYLAAGFLFLPVIVFLHKQLSLRMFFVVSVGILALLGGFTRFSATVWSDYPSMVAASARKAPTSARAQGQYATDLFNAGRPEEALRVLDEAIARNPSHHPLLFVTRLNILCYGAELDAREFDRVAAQLSGVYYDPRSIRLYTLLTTSVVERRCPDVSIHALQSFFFNLLKYPYNADRKHLGYSHIRYFIGITQAYTGDPEAAVASFEESLQSRPGASHAMLMAALLASNDYFDEALHVSDLALVQIDADRRSTIGGARVSAEDIRDFQATVRADRDAAGQDGGTSDPVE